MSFYYVWVRSHRYHGATPLTYTHATKLPTGSIVSVQLQRETVLGVISGPAPQPRFTTKPISRVYDLPPVPAHLLKTAVWLQANYPAPLGILTQQLIPAAFTDAGLATEASNPFDVPDTTSLPPLTTEQAQALEAMSLRDTYVLHGTTGSGKTRLYIELAGVQVAAAKSVIILTPEISLTTQLANSFQAVFGNRVIVMHSQQTPAERRRAWLDCLRAREAVVVVGPRSALFSPVASLGLIVLDEAHEAAYKQEQAPQYQTARVASFLSNLVHCSLVFGSATPSLTDYFIAQQKSKPIIRLTSLAQTAPQRPTAIRIIDRGQHDLFSRSPYLSQPLIAALEAGLKRHEQGLLYLNRRGTARLVLCQNCGWQAMCPHCDLPLTYHADRHQLRCHSCDHHANAPVSCPSCGHPEIIFKTAGTKAIVAEVERLFPSARVSRFDTDNTKSERLDQQYAAIKNGEVDILVGTQLLAKGLDLPRLSTLGIVLADTSLYMPDFSAQERTYQLINQVLGRIGRGHIAGQAFIQTYHPEQPVLLDAIEGNYQRFYKRELAERQQYLFPPFCYLLKLTLRRASTASAEAATEKLKLQINQLGYPVRIEGPAPAFAERFQSKYQWQLVIKAKQRSHLLQIIASLPANVAYDIDPIDLL